MSNPLGSNQMLAQPKQYGDILKEQSLERAAPVSGAPTVPKPKTGRAAATISRPAPSGAGPGMAPLSPAPNPKLAYYSQLANTWTALAGIHGASPIVKDLAKQARTYLQNMQEGQV